MIESLIMRWRQDWVQSRPDQKTSTRAGTQERDEDIERRLSILLVYCILNHCISEVQCLPEGAFDSEVALESSLRRLGHEFNAAAPSKPSYAHSLQTPTIPQNHIVCSLLNLVLTFGGSIFEAELLALLFFSATAVAALI